ncbi:hypothetical protein P7C71_g24, partial [Lecanoromycetidae sp. Uapishka_2]
MLPWSTKRRRVDPNNLDPDVSDQVKELKAQIEQLNEELRIMEEGEEGKTLIEPLLADLSEEDQKKVREAIKQDEIETARKAKEMEAVKRELAKYAPQKRDLEIQWQLPPEHSAYLRNLNANIMQAANNLTDEGLRKKLWLSYARCKAFLPPFLQMIPDKSWDVLWASQQSVASTDDPHWAPHVVELSEDMMEAGKELNIYQKILYIEALNQVGRQNHAIAQWEELTNHIGNDKRAAEEHELLGVRLFASHGDTEKAERIALDFLGDRKPEESRILIPILGAWAQRADDVGIKHAWALYLRFRAQVGSRITMDDYDNINMSFLNAQRTDLALAVFKDMMLTGQQSDQESMELYSKSLSLIGKTQSRAISVDDLNKISMTGLTVLPKKFQNKFFYGSWLKRLIGMGALDAAASVIELMYERGVKPDPKHLNGIIGAWLRAGNDRDRDAAEKMAWAMIYERLDFVKRRRGGKNNGSSEPAPSVQIRVPPHLRRTISPANVETFSLLLQHYGRRAQEENVRLIQEYLELAEIRPNTYFINHLLYIDLRRGQHQAAWLKYQQLFRKIQPDLETFAALWDCEKAHLESLLIHHQDKFPNPRGIMSHMMNWFSRASMKPKERELIQQDFSKELYDQILRCICLAMDQEAVIVALYAMKESFGFYPDKDTARLVSMYVGRMGIGEKEARQAGRSRRKRNPQRQQNAIKIAQAFQIISEQRIQVLAEQGIGELEQCDDFIQKEEGLFILAEFLRTVLRRTSVDEGLVDGNIEKAAWDMGVSGIRMEDPLTMGLYNKE